MSLAGPSWGKLKPGVRIISLSELEVALIKVHRDGTAITFPVKPTVHVGKKDGFDIVYVGNDLVVSARSESAQTNLFVYIDNKRYTLKLRYFPQDGDQIVSIRDPKEELIEVEVVP